MLLKHILLVAAFVPFVVSHESESKCGKDSFWWDDKDKGCCLRHGGPPNPPSPPPDTKCPKDSHYWNKDKDCCTPRNPPHKDDSPPECPKDWEWKSDQHKCKPCPTPPSPPKHQPSPKPGYQKDHGHKKRSTPLPVCPSRLQACPVSSEPGAYQECVDTATELESCGGCTTLGKGQNCNKIEGAWNVACEQGTCKVYTCEGGYKLDADNNTCVLL